LTPLSVKGQETMPVLTADGRLIHITRDQVAAAGRPPSDPVVRSGVPGRKWVMVIDLASCDGCGTCTKACSKMHFVPPDREWIPVMKMRETPETSPYFFPKPCFHCDNPPCTKVCPVGATFKRQDGVVLIDNERCIGCRFCMAACPYSTRHFNWGHPQEPEESRENGYSPENGHPRRVGTVEKCDFCPDMAEKGMLPACASSCPFGVIYYGDENEDAVTNGLGVTVRLSKLLEERAAYRYMEELGTEPRVYYLPPKNRKFPGPKLAPVGSKSGASHPQPQPVQPAAAGQHTHAN
jgi:molybdopterin-containing oxidoreductase family iron-sulfur binding subunit